MSELTFRSETSITRAHAPRNGKARVDLEIALLVPHTISSVSTIEFTDAVRKHLNGKHGISIADYNYNMSSDVVRVFDAHRSGDVTMHKHITRVGFYVSDAEVTISPEGRPALIPHYEEKFGTLVDQATALFQKAGNYQHIQGLEPTPLRRQDATCG